jgi:hypothetical protein
MPALTDRPSPWTWIAGSERTAREEIDAALTAWGLPPGRPVLISVGAAAHLDPALAETLRNLFSDLVPILERCDAAVIDGGTAFGVMALMGEVRRAHTARFPLIGIAPRDKVQGPHPAERSDDPGRVALDPGHSHVLLVPGSHWGDESPWLSIAADRLADGSPTLMLVAAGGEITLLDVKHRLRTGGKVLVLAGSGGTADRLAGWAAEGAAHDGSMPGFDPGDGTRDLLQVVRLETAPDVLPRLLERHFSR